jgi:hypothetical protein
MGGLLIVYTVVTSWRSLRSALSLQYSDFKDFHTSLEKILKDHPILLKSMPKLPDPKLFILTSKIPDVQGANPFVCVCVCVCELMSLSTV